MKALHGQYSFRRSLYDPWQGMRAEELLPTEIQSVVGHSCLSIETTKNLMMVNDNCSFRHGSIPGSLSSATVLPEVNSLHLDLISAIRTQAALVDFGI